MIKFNKHLPAQRRHVYLGLVTLLAAVALMVLESPEEFLSTQTQVDSSSNELPYAIAINATTRQYNELGHAAYEFSAKRIEHFDGEKQTGAQQFDPYTLLHSLELRVLEGNDAPWYLSAQKGELSDDQQLFKLWEDVKVARPNNEGKTELKTTEVLVDLHTKIAETQALVNLTSGGLNAQAKGMRVDLNTKTISLLSNVQGKHDIQ